MVNGKLYTAEVRGNRKKLRGVGRGEGEETNDRSTWSMKEKLRGGRGKKRGGFENEYVNHMQF